MDSIDGLFDPAYTCPLIESTHEKCNADGSDAAQWFEALETYKNSIRSHAHDPSWCVPPSQAFSLYPELLYQPSSPDAEKRCALLDWIDSGQPDQWDRLKLYLSQTGHLSENTQQFRDNLIKLAQTHLQNEEDTLGQLFSALLEGDSVHVPQLESHILYLFRHMAVLPEGLVDAIFEFYAENLEHFDRLIRDATGGRDIILGEEAAPNPHQEPNSSQELLAALIQPFQLSKIKNPETALSIGIALVHHHPALPDATLNYFTLFLKDDYQDVWHRAIFLYAERAEQGPIRIGEEGKEGKILIDALLSLLPKLNDRQHEQVSVILDQIELNEIEQSKRAIQNRFFEFYQLDAVEEQLAFISQTLYPQISAECAEEYICFFKGLLLSSHMSLRVVASFAIIALQQHRTIAFNFQESASFQEISSEKDLKALVLSPFDARRCIEGEWVHSTDLQMRLVHLRTQIQSLLHQDPQEDSFWSDLLEADVVFLTAYQACHALQKSTESWISGFHHLLSLIQLNDVQELKDLLAFIQTNVLPPETFSFINTPLGVQKLHLILFDQLMVQIKNIKSLSPYEIRLFNIELPQLIVQKEWPIDFLFGLIYPAIVKLPGKPTSIGETYQQMIRVLDKLVRYPISASIKDPTGRSILEWLREQSAADCLVKMNAFLRACDETTPKPVSRLLQEMRETNSHHAWLLRLIGDHLEDNYFTVRLDRIHAFIKQPISIKNSPRSLRSWRQGDFVTWRQSINWVDDRNIAEVLAVLSQAAHITLFDRKSYARETQLIAVLSLFKSPQGGLAQIATGEGKSLIIAMLAVINALQGRQVDIVVPSSVLAKRDAWELQFFYAQFGMTVAHNINDRGGGGEAKTCYEADIVYGDLLHFIGDTLRDLSDNVKLGRGFDALLVDEVDNLFIDQIHMRVQLSGVVLGFETLNPLFVYMQGKATLSASLLEQGKDQCYSLVPVLDEEQQREITEYNLTAIESAAHHLNKTRKPLGVENCYDHLKASIANYTRDVLFAWGTIRANRSVIVPKHLEDFSNRQLDRWVESLMRSYTLQEKSHYLVYRVPEGGRHDFRVIAPIDYDNTGEIQHSMQWSDGLHPFLQIKHNLTLLPEHVVSIFMSYFGFFNKYKGHLYGVTGTLGVSSHHQFLRDVYGVELAVIPTFIKKNFIEFPPITFETDAEWRKEIIGVIQREIQDSRACLVILETIASVERLAGDLIRSGYSPTHVFVYGTGRSTGEYPVNRKRELQPSEVILATNMAGRGMDLKVSDAVKRNGGLHVIMGVFVPSVRVEAQGFGRTARQGEPGTAQVMALMQQIGRTRCPPEMKCLQAERHLAEMARLQHNQHCDLPYLTLHDQLFNLYVELIKEADSSTGYKLILGNPEQVEPKSLYLYARDTDVLRDQMEIILKMVPDPHSGRKVAEYEIATLLHTLDPRVEKHMRTVLSDQSHSVSSLNKKDHEMIHFIATSEGYTDYPDMYKRVSYQFVREVNKKNKGNIAQYLSDLLQQDPEFTDLKGKQSVSSFYVEMRKKYLLWVKDRHLYNNKHEMAQITEYWGTWLKQYDSLLYQQRDCQKGQTQAYYLQLEAKLREDFKGFRQQLQERKENGKLVQNPSYLVLKAWQYFDIYHQTQYRSNGWFGWSEAGEEGRQQAPEGWLDWAKKVVQETLHYVVEGLKSRMNFGQENYAPANPLGSAIAFVEQARQLDDVYTWTADNARSYIALVRDGREITEAKQANEANRIKEVFCRDTANAMEKIQNYVIPSLEAQLAFLRLQQKVNYTDDLAIQLIGTREIYRAILMAMHKNIELVAHTSGKEMVRLDRYIPLEEVTQSINMTEAILARANQTARLSTSAYLSLDEIAKALDIWDRDIQFTSKSFIVNQITAEGGYLFTLTKYELHEERNWFGTVFAVIVGIASIMTGLWMLNTFSNVFALSLGVSLVMQGVGDLLQAAISVIEKRPIDFKSYLNAKGTAVGVALLVACTLSFLDLSFFFNGAILDGIKEGIQLVTAGKTALFLGKIAAIQAATRVLSQSLLYFGKQEFIDPEDIKKEARQVIEDIIIAYHATLNLIFATDAVYRDKTLQDRLYQAIQALISRYRGRFQSDRHHFGIGAGAQVGGQLLGGFNLWGFTLGGVAEAAAKVSLGVVKNAEAMGEIADGTKQVIAQVGSTALRSGDLMADRLQKDFGEEKTKQLLTALKTQGYLNHGEIDYQDCLKLNGTILEADLTQYIPGLVGSCESVKALLLDTYVEQYGALKNQWINSVSAAIEGIQEYEMLSPAADLLGSTLGNQIASWIFDKINKGNEYEEWEKEKKLRDRKKDQKKFTYEQDKDPWSELFEERPQEEPAEDLPADSKATDDESLPSSRKPSEPGPDGEEVFVEDLKNERPSKTSSTGGDPFDTLKKIGEQYGFSEKTIEALKAHALERLSNTPERQMTIRDGKLYIELPIPAELSNGANPSFVNVAAPVIVIGLALVSGMIIGGILQKNVIQIGKYYVEVPPDVAARLTFYEGRYWGSANSELGRFADFLNQMSKKEGDTPPTGPDLSGGSASPPPPDPDDWNSGDYEKKPHSKPDTELHRQGVKQPQFSNDPYVEAKMGGVHHKQYGEFTKQNVKQLEKSIRSFDKNIQIHEGYIQSPKSHVSNWNSLTPRHQESLINHWKNDIARAREYKYIAEQVIKSKLGKGV